jgi:glyoxylase-like metal-dependent hydrolase (beta-lactamase superfamily II)/rhodanese-related sulfurtransferase
MIFRQITHDDLGCASYLIGDEHAGVAAVVDPKLDVEEYLALARYMGVRIEHVLETHNHADHVSGHGRLVAATGATMHVHRDAAPDYEHEPFDDGWELELGSVRIRALHTPGHRPEHTAFALVDTARGPEPWAVLTGDTLFVGDVARPDLAVDREEGARGMFESLHEKLLPLPPECEVWPGHLGGSLCGGPGMDMKVSSTIAYESAHNELLGERDEGRFVERAIASLAPQPPNFQAIVAANRGPLRNEGTHVDPLTPRQVELARADGALIVDVRTDRQYDDAHIPDAICNPAVRAGFGTKLAWVADRDQDIVLVGRDDEDAIHAAHLAAAVGVTHIAGYLAGGMTSWREEKRPTDAVERIDVAELHERASAVQMLDVREREEWETGHIPGSIHVPYHELDAVPEGIDRDRPIAVICSSGQRSALAASLLRRMGAREVIHVADGGVGTWHRRGWPIAGPDAGAAGG